MKLRTRFLGRRNKIVGVVVRGAPIDPVTKKLTGPVQDLPTCDFSQKEAPKRLQGTTLKHTQRTHVCLGKLTTIREEHLSGKRV